MTASIEGDAAGEVTSLAGRRVTVMGLGMFGGGLGAARWALGEGARVTVTDRKERGELEDAVATLEAVDAPHPVRWTLGRHEAEDFDRADVVIVNPAVPPTSPWIERARAAGAEVTTATALLLERCPARVVAVTGTQGKSSTSSFLRDLLEGSGDGPGRCLLGGNIGGSLLDELADLTPDDVLVLELSSYQLEHLPDRIRGVIDVAAITNVGVDHLERHGTVEAYRDAKLRMLDLVRPGGAAVVPAGELADRARARLGSRPPARVVTHGPGGEVDLADTEVVRRGPGGPRTLADASQLQVPGRFQRLNLAVALAAAAELGADAERLGACVPELRGLGHRMESLGWVPVDSGEVHVIDNGVSTTPESTLAAVESVEQDGPAILVAGGQVKRGVDLDRLARRLAGPGEWVLVPFGAAADDLTRAAVAAGVQVAEPGVEADGVAAAAGTAEEATARALELAGRTGARTLLFSPACASFDRYANFEARARAFRRVLPLPGSPRPLRRAGAPAAPPAEGDAPSHAPGPAPRPGGRT